MADPCFCGKKTIGKGQTMAARDGSMHSWSRCANDRQTYILLRDGDEPDYGETVHEPPAPPSAEKLALRGEPTARMLVEVLLAEVERMSGALHTAAALVEAARVLAVYNDNAASERAFERGVVEANAAATPQTIAAARAYLSTRAPAEDALIEAARAWVDGPSFNEPAFQRLRLAARALPVEGRAPDHEHDLQGNCPACGTTSEQMGKKGAKP